MQTTNIPLLPIGGKIASILARLDDTRKPEANRNSLRQKLPSTLEGNLGELGGSLVLGRHYPPIASYLASGILSGGREPIVSGMTQGEHWTRDGKKPFLAIRVSWQCPPQVEPEKVFRF